MCKSLSDYVCCELTLGVYNGCAIAPVGLDVRMCVCVCACVRVDMKAASVVARKKGRESTSGLTTQR